MSTQGYYRFPTIHDDLIIFTAEGDLWRSTAEGGLAQRLTTHHGIEAHAAVSPDGSMIAFSAQYEGPTEVYVMGVDGGRPFRLTHEEDNALVVGWTPAGEVIYSTRRYATLPSTQLCTIHPHTQDHTRIPLAEASDGCYTPEGDTLFFTRLPFQGSHTKRYQGGTAQNIWKFTTGTPEAVSLTDDYPGTSKRPMVWNGRIYFATDRDGTMNIWSMDADGGSLTQHTFHQGWDIQNPQLHNGRIVYQLGADIWLLILESQETRPIPIMLPSDFEQMRQRWVRNPLSYLTSWSASPNGDRLLLTSRGRLFVAPVENGRLIELTRESGVRYRSAQFLPDGETAIALSDATGELEFYTMPADGMGQATAITNNGTVFRYMGAVSPDGQWMLFGDRDQKLWLTHLATKETRLVAESANSPFFHLTWAPDSRWAAYVVEADNQYPQIMLLNVDSMESTAVTSDRTDSYSPAWSPDGKWLYFLSDRHFNSLVSSPWGPRQPEPYFDRTTKIYMLALQAGLRSPFLPDDELTRAEEKEKKKEAPAEKPEPPSDQQEADQPEPSAEKEPDSETAVSPIDIQLDGLSQRLIELPIVPGNYRYLTVNDKALFWMDVITGEKPQRNLLALPIGNQEPEVQRLASDMNGFELTKDGKSIVMQDKENQFCRFEASGQPPKPSDAKQVPLKNWMFAVDRQAEWRQMLIEAWRLERDYFYDRNLHGVDWPAVLERHLPLVERVTDRHELNDLVAQMVSELSALHTFVHRGDLRWGREHIPLASLGARWERDEAAGGYRLVYLYETEPDFPERRGPLKLPHIDLQVGDVIEQINGVDTLSVPNAALLLQNRAGEQVRLRVKTAVSDTPRDYIVYPISMDQEATLRYDDWEYSRRLLVEELGGGQLGYLHLRAMRGDNYPEWAKNYYPVYNRSGLIIDVRHNRGGNIDSWILGKLLRQAWFYWQPRVGNPTWNMHYAFRGHMVVLVNANTASDGEAFAEGFRRLGLGKVIGTRTWGGEIWLSHNNWLVDKGIATAAQTGVYSPDGEWVIEGHGVEPDLVVDNLPHATFNGEDAQLKAAVSHLLALIEADPRPVPAAPPHPDKSFPYDM